MVTDTKNDTRAQLNIPAANPAGTYVRRHGVHSCNLFGRSFRNRHYFVFRLFTALWFWGKNTWSFQVSLRCFLCVSPCYLQLPPICRGSRPAVDHMRQCLPSREERPGRSGIPQDVNTEGVDCSLSAVERRGISVLFCSWRQVWGGVAEGIRRLNKNAVRSKVNSGGEDGDAR